MAAPAQLYTGPQVNANMESGIKEKLIFTTGVGTLRNLERIISIATSIAARVMVEVLLFLMKKTFLSYRPNDRYSQAT